METVVISMKIVDFFEKVSQTFVLSFRKQICQFFIKLLGIGAYFADQNHNS